MAKYHISPTTGRPNICRAVQTCPLGGEHFNTKDEARLGYESLMAGETLPAPMSGQSVEFDGLDFSDELADEAKIFAAIANEPMLDDDFSDIKCDDCQRSLDHCTCGECEYCGALDTDGPDAHDEDCPSHRTVYRAYSWD